MEIPEFKKIKASRDPRFNEIPGTNGLPILGSLYLLMYDLPAFIRSHYERYGLVFRVKAGPERIVIVLGSELSRKVLIDNDRQYSTELGYQRLAPLFGQGLLQHDFDEHRFQRRIFQTAFTPTALRNYLGILAREIDRDVEQWQHIRGFRLYKHVKALLLRSGLAVFYGIHESPEKNEELATAFEGMLEGTLRLFDVNLPGFKFHKALKGRKLLRDYMARLIPERRTGNGKDVLSHICKERKETGEYFSEKELLDHAVFLLLAAHDTNASLLQHLIYYLTLYPEWLERLRAEVAERSIHDLTYEDVRGMKAMGWVIDEVLRKNSSTPAMMRRTLETVTLGGVSIPPNSYLFLVPGFNHHDPEEWLNPNRFDPRRFSPEHTECRGRPFSYIPFGGGAHKCIGMHFARMQAALFVGHFISSYEFSTPPGYKAKFEYMPLAKIRDGLPLKLKPRNRPWVTREVGGEEGESTSFETAPEVESGSRTASMQSIVTSGEAGCPFGHNRP